MANKSQKQIRREARKENVKGNDYTVSVATHGFHNNTKGVFTTRTIPARNYVLKKKVKPFPKPNQDGPSMSEQREKYHNYV